MPGCLVEGGVGWALVAGGGGLVGVAGCGRLWCWVCFVAAVALLVGCVVSAVVRVGLSGRFAAWFGWLGVGGVVVSISVVFVGWRGCGGVVRLGRVAGGLVVGEGAGGGGGVDP